MIQNQSILKELLRYASKEELCTVLLMTEKRRKEPKSTERIWKTMKGSEKSQNDDWKVILNNFNDWKESIGVHKNNERLVYSL